MQDLNSPSSEAPKAPKPSPRASVRLPNPTFAELNRVAAGLGMTISAAVRECLIIALPELEAKHQRQEVKP